MTTFINGLGTVGNRIARALLSMGADVHGSKRALDPDDRRTQELLSVINEFGPFPVHVVRGDRLEQRVQTFKSASIPVLETRDFSRYNAIIDATPDETAQENAEEYVESGKPFLLQGGASHDVVARDFLSAPEAVGYTRYDEYKTGNARQVSCNTSFAATALGIVLRRLSKHDTTIKTAVLTLYRRLMDPGEKKVKTPKPELKPSHHAQDVMNVLPQLEGKITSQANTNPWYHFHRTEILVRTDQPITRGVLEDVITGFKTYSRCIYADDDVGAQGTLNGINKLLKLSDELGIPDGDILLPVYTVMADSATTFKVVGYTPQRSIPVLSSIDWLWAATGKCADAPSAVLHTNSHVKWYGHSVYGIKQGAEKLLNTGHVHPTVYAERFAETVP